MNLMMENNGMRDIVERLETHAFVADKTQSGMAPLFEECLDEITRLRAENEKLREALKPFAAAIVSYDDPDIDGGFTIEWDIYPKDLEAARKALGTEE